MACCDVNTPILPASATAGLTFTATVTLPDYLTAEWAVVAHLRGPQSIDLPAVESDLATYTFAATAVTTSGWATGVYWYSVRATKGADVVEIGTGELRVDPDLAAAGAGFDGRSENEIALAAIEAVLSRRATIDQERYSINNRELWRTPIADLLKLRGFYAAMVARERARRNGDSVFGRRVRVGF